MIKLLTLRDEDIFPKDHIFKEVDWSPAERVAVRCIVRDEENNIALCGTKNRLLPGGGVDEGETLEQTAVRECLEEIGCDVDVLGKVGFCEEFRDHGKRHQITHCYHAKVIGEKGIPQSTQEDELNMKVYWHPFEQIQNIIEGQIKTIPYEGYNSCFNARISLAFFNEYQKLCKIEKNK